MITTDIRGILGAIPASMEEAHQAVREAFPAVREAHPAGEEMALAVPTGGSEETVSAVLPRVSVALRPGLEEISKAPHAGMIPFR